MTAFMAYQTKSALPAPLSDTELIALTANGDRDAFAELMRRHMHTMNRMVYSMCFDKDLTEDLLQETWLRVWKNAGRKACRYKCT